MHQDTPTTAFPPQEATSTDAQAVLVTLRATARDAAAFREHLNKVIPVTRQASGCRYSHTYQNPAAPQDFLLVQSWDSLTQQQGYIAWRDARGDLAEFQSFLVQPPSIEVFVCVDV